MADAQTPEEFYKGKQIKLIVGTDVGGGADTYGRFLARYIAQYIPGQPNVIVENMSGAGGIRAANYLQNIGPQDGSEFSIIIVGLPLSQVLGGVGVKFDLTKFNWIGNMSQSPNVVIAWHTTQVRTMDDAREKELALGATSPLDTSSMTALFANSVLGTKFRVVKGYNSGAAIDLAIERGEIGGRANITWAQLKAERPYWIENKLINVLAQTGLERIPELSQVPRLVEFAKNDDDRDLLAFLSNLGVAARAVAFGPGVPADRTAALRHAFDAAMKDPAVLAEGKRSIWTSVR